MSFLRPFALFAAACFVLAACGSGPGSTDTPTPTPRAISPSGSATPLTKLPKCQKQQHRPIPDWVPQDLPLPDGTYFTRTIAGQGGYSEGLFVVPLHTTDIAKYVLKKWPEAGYTLGRGDAEPGEVEDQFAKSPGIGAFKAQDAFCKDPYSIMLLIWAPDRSKIGSTGTSGGSPLPGATPSASPSPSPKP